MTFDHDFGYFFPRLSSLLKEREEEKENEVANIVIKSHAFLLDLLFKREEIIEEETFLTLGRKFLNYFLKNHLH